MARDTYLRAIELIDSDTLFCTTNLMYWDECKALWDALTPSVAELYWHGCRHSIKAYLTYKIVPVLS